MDWVHPGLPETQSSGAESCSPFYQKHHDVFAFKANEEMIVQPLPHSSGRPASEHRVQVAPVTEKGRGQSTPEEGSPRPGHGEER